QLLDAFGEARDGLVLARHHGREVEADTLDLDAVPRQHMPGLGVFFGGVEQRLRRDAADIEAGAAQRLALVDAYRLHAELCRPDRGDIAARPSPDHHHIRLVRHGPPGSISSYSTPVGRV